MNVDPYKMQDFLKKATQKLSNNEINKSSQKADIDSQKSLFDECENCIQLKKDLKLEEKTVLTFCDLIDPTGEKSINECIENLKQIIKQNEILTDHYKKTKNFIYQQYTGRVKIDLDVNDIKYLRDVKELTFEEIAKKYNVSRNTIRNRYYKE